MNTIVYIHSCAVVTVTVFNNNKYIGGFLVTWFLITIIMRYTGNFIFQVHFGNPIILLVDHIFFHNIYKIVEKLNNQHFRLLEVDDDFQFLLAICYFTTKFL